MWGRPPSYPNDVALVDRPKPCFSIKTRRFPNLVRKAYWDAIERFVA